MIRKLFYTLILSVAVIGCVASCAPASSFQHKDGELLFCAIDVGQGDASLFILPNGKTILVDAGTIKNGKQTESFIRKNFGIKKIDLLVATHPHEDHIGGMQEILRSFKVGKIWDPGFDSGSKLQYNFYKTIKEKNIPFVIAKRGLKSKMGDVKIEVLAPKVKLRNTHSDSNNHSIVMKITYGDVSFLLTGDMELEEYKTIAPLPHATILKMPHHGSSNAMTFDILREEIKPAIATLSYGRNNSYGHPHREVKEYIRKLKIKRFDTVDGPIFITTDGKKYTYAKNRIVKEDSGKWKSQASDTTDKKSVKNNVGKNQSNNSAQAIKPIINKSGLSRILKELIYRFAQLMINKIV